MTRDRSHDDYSSWPLDTDHSRFGLTTSAIRVGDDTVSVRHGRRTLGSPATIFLHGAAGSWSTWAPLLCAADAVDTPGAWRLTDVIIPDLPGWGDSLALTDPRSATIESLAVTVAGVARALGYESWVVVGHSMGGVVALDLAATEPDATVAVGLISPATFAVRDSVRNPLTGSGMVPAFAGLLLVMRVLAALGASGRGLLYALSRMRLLRIAASPLFARPARVHASVFDALIREIRPAQFARAAARLGAYDVIGAWTRVLCPVEVGVGDKDVFIGDHDADRLRACIRDIRISTVTGTGHFAHVERPAAVLHLFQEMWPDPARAVSACPA